jgi:tight adherence protein B
MFKKKEKAPLEPQYYESPTGIPTYNYKVYYMTKLEKIIYFLIAFAVGAAVGYLFYGGIGKDDLGNATTVTYVLDIIVCVLVGGIAGKMFLPIRTQQIIKKRKNDLKLQFRELLDALATSIGSGKNIVDSFKSAYDDLSIIYNEDASIIKELAIILDGNNNNIEIEKSLMDMGLRSGIDDIVSFANVFETCYRKGGDIKDVIKNTQQIINEKMEVQMDIETIVTSSKNEENVMTVLPIALIALIKLMSPEFSANFVTPVGIISTTIAIVMFVIARKVGQKVLDIKI